MKPTKNCSVAVDDDDLINDTIFDKIGNCTKIYVLIVSPTLSETFLILRRIRRDFIINICLCIKYQLFLSDFNET